MCKAVPRPARINKGVKENIRAVLQPSYHRRAYTLVLQWLLVTSRPCVRHTSLFFQSGLRDTTHRALHGHW
eukprot:jgi/Chrzof1/6015/Cz17g01050.t1